MLVLLQYDEPRLALSPWPYCPPSMGMVPGGHSETIQVGCALSHKKEGSYVRAQPEGGGEVLHVCAGITRKRGY